ncbi:MAG TPA: flagellar basal-body rod protein FlgG [Candidatus Latescibacteria bacterium]|nr:flagellar basal-body rod protein FlgG [Candidatus Latescibacterota bacterium]
MIRSMRAAATGLIAQELNVTTIANNLANINTTGFKKSRIEFQDLLYETMRQAGSSRLQGAEVPVELQIGYGTRPVATHRIFSQGEIQPTNNPLDIAIEGDGFFQISMPNGDLAYTRDGTFKLSPDGKIVTSDGFTLYPDLVIPEDATDIHIGADGTVSVMVYGEKTPLDLGGIELVRFINPAGLKAIGGNLMVATATSGEPILGSPGSEGFGTLSQGYLELSNVQVVEEMVNMIIAQRAYEINSKVIETSEEMASIANRLKR